MTLGLEQYVLQKMIDMVQGIQSCRNEKDSSSSKNGGKGLELLRLSPEAENDTILRAGSEKEESA